MTTSPPPPAPSAPSTQYANSNRRIPYITTEGEVSYISRLTHVPVVYHSEGADGGEGSAHFLFDKVSPEEWNALSPFVTKLSKDTPSLTANRQTDDAKITSGWSDMSVMTKYDIEERGDRKEKHERYKKRTLLQCAGRHVVGKPRTVMLFHGTTASHMNSMLNNGIRDVGGGALGKGFYMTFNPNEAKAYACETGNSDSTHLLAIGEFHVREAAQIRWSVLQGKCKQGKTNVVRCKQMPNQICFQKDMSDITLVKIHMMAANKMEHHGISGRNSKARVCTLQAPSFVPPPSFATVKHTNQKRRGRHTRRIKGHMSARPLTPHNMRRAVCRDDTR
jgi:hypothetical protein